MRKIETASAPALPERWRSSARLRRKRRAGAGQRHADHRLRLQRPSRLFLRRARQGLLQGCRSRREDRRGQGIGRCDPPDRRQQCACSALPMPARWCWRAPTTRSRSRLVAIVYAKPPQAIFCREDAGLKKPKDLEGKSIANPAGGSILDMFPVYAKAAGIDASKVKWMVAGSDALPGLLASEQGAVRRPVHVGEPLLRAQVAPAKLVRFAYSDAGLSYLRQRHHRDRRDDRDQARSRAPLRRGHHQGHEGSRSPIRTRPAPSCTSIIRR